MLIALAILAIAVFALAGGVALLYRLLLRIQKALPPGDTASLPNTAASAPEQLDAPRKTDAPTDTAAVRKMVHDMANLLGTIHGFTNAAIDDLPKNNPIRTDLMEVLDASERAQTLLKEWRNSLRAAQDTRGASQPPPVASDDTPAPPSYRNNPSYPPVAKPVPNDEKAAPPPSSPAETAANVNRILDRAEAAVKAGEALESIPTKSGQRRKLVGSEHLLIVDDEHQLLTMFRRIFEPQGYRVTTFSNGLMAWDDFQKHSDLYDLAILDQRMPEMSGMSLAIEMLNCRPDFPIILLSGFTESIRPDDAARIGIRHFLSKPIPQSELSATIRKTLDESHLFHS